MGAFAAVGVEAMVKGVDGFVKDMGRMQGGVAGFTDKADRSSGIIGKLGSALGTVAKVGVGAAIAGFGALTAVIGASISAAADAQQVDAQLNQVLKTTGGVAGMTKKKILDLANALSQVTPFEDEVIVSTETMLLQFKNIGEEVFPQATEMALDLAQRLGIDTASAAKLLGKALETPGEGLLRLKAAGVAFSDEQEKMILKMAEAGDLAGAQKLIMDELAKSIGGAARAAGNTLAGKLEILKNNIGNVKEAIGTAFIPILTDLAGKFSDFVLEHGPKLAAMFEKLTTETIPNIVHALSPFVKAFQDLTKGDVEGSISAFAAGVGEIAKHLLGVDPVKAADLAVAINQIGQKAREYSTAVADFAISLGETVKEKALGWFLFHGEELKTALEGVGAGLLALVPEGIAVNLDGLSGALGKLTMLSLDAFLVSLTTLSDWFTANGDNLGTNIQFISEQFDRIAGSIGTLSGSVSADNGNTAKFFALLTEINMGNLSWTLGGLSVAMDGVATAIEWLVPELESLYVAVATKLGVSAPTLDVVSAAFGRVGQTLIGVLFPMAGVRWALEDLVKTLQRKGPDIVKALDKINADFEAWAAGIPGAIDSAIRDAEVKLEAIGKSIVDGIKAGVEQAWGDFVAYITARIPDIIKAIMDEIKGGSPARAFMPIGESMAQGVAVGWQKAWAASSGMLAAEMVMGPRGTLAAEMVMGPRGMMPAMSGAYSSVAARGGDTSIGGDTYINNIQSRESWAMAQSWMDSRRQERLNMGM